MSFIWDEWNREHLKKHRVSQTEAKYVLENRRPPFPHYLGDGMYQVKGRTAAGRYLQVIYSFKSDEDLDYDGDYDRFVRPAIAELLHPSRPRSDGARETSTATEPRIMKKRRRKDFFEMTPAERDAYVAQFDEEIDIADTKPLTLKQQVLHLKAVQKGTSKRIFPLKIDSKLLNRAGRLAQSRGITLDQLIEQDLRGFFAPLRR